MEKNINTILNFVKKNKLFGNLSETQQMQIAQLAVLRIVDQGECFIKEGEEAEDVYIIMEGEVEITKHEPHSTKHHRLAMLGKGNSIGEVSLLDSSPRSASVIATKPSVLLKLSISELKLLSQVEPSIHEKMTMTLAQEMSRRLRETNSSAVELLHKELENVRDRVNMATLICKIFMAITCYILLIDLVFGLQSTFKRDIIVVLPLTVITAISLVVFVKMSVFKLKQFGLTFLHWRKALYEGVLYSMPMFAIILFIKWLCIRYCDGFSEMPMFSMGQSFTSSPTVILLLMVAYVIYAFFQELIFRGCLQYGLQYFLEAKYKKWLAILIGSLSWNLSHLHAPPDMIMLTIFLGVFFGWLYSRHKSLLGVWVARSLIGLFIFYVVGFPGLHVLSIL